MQRFRVTSIILLILAAALPAAAQTAEDPSNEPGTPTARPLKDRVYFGGGIGASFGDVDYVQVTPIVGFSVTRDFSMGLAVSYIYRQYPASPEDVSTNDYGFDLFARYRVVPQFFLQLQYSYTDFEYPLVSGGTDRDAYSAVLGGGGFVQSLGGRAAFVISALYDFTYASDDLTPYDSPWVVSAGVTFGF